ncbi:hypothetical protein MHYP_G00130210 [Metynnis hypsauchen]
MSIHSVYVPRCSSHLHYKAGGGGMLSKVSRQVIRQLHSETKISCENGDGRLSANAEEEEGAHSSDRLHGFCRCRSHICQHLLLTHQA